MVSLVTKLVNKNVVAAGVLFKLFLVNYYSNLEKSLDKCKNFVLNFESKCLIINFDLEVTETKNLSRPKLPFFY